MNPDLIKETWADVAAFGLDNVASRFYARLFVEHPDTRRLFGHDMAGQRRKITRTLQLVVDSADDLDAVTPVLQRLGRKHRSYGALEEHYKAVGDALLATLAYFLDDRWTDEIADSWTQAFTAVATIMIDAARAVADQPAAWDAEILIAERKADQVRLVLNPGPGYPPATRARATLNARPGSWRMLDLQPYPDGRLVTVVTLDDSDPITLALLQAQPGDFVRLGHPLDELEEP